MENNLKEKFITLNEVLENIQYLWVDMTDEEKDECVQEFFGLRNKIQMLRFVQKYTPVRH